LFFSSILIQPFFLEQTNSCKEDDKKGKESIPHQKKSRHKSRRRMARETLLTIPLARSHKNIMCYDIDSPFLLTLRIMSWNCNKCSKMKAVVQLFKMRLKSL
jgi:hypothetical protein